MYITNSKHEEPRHGNFFYMIITMAGTHADISTHANEGHR